MKTDGEHYLKISEMTTLLVRPDFDAIGFEYDVQKGLIIMKTLEFMRQPHEMLTFTVYTPKCKLNLMDNFYRDNRKLGMLKIEYGANKSFHCSIYVSNHSSAAGGWMQCQ